MQSLVYKGFTFMDLSEFLDTAGPIYIIPDDFGFLQPFFAYYLPAGLLRRFWISVFYPQHSQISF